MLKIYRVNEATIGQLKKHSDVLNRARVLTIGAFDGLHLGHQELIKRLVHAKNKLNALALVISFYPHPDIVLGKAKNVEILSDFRQKVKILKNLGVDELVLIHFTKKFAQTSALDFFNKIIIENCNAQHLVLGPDTKIGHKREGDPEWLKKKMSEMRYTAEVISTYTIDNVQISSSNIRNSLEQGDLQSVEKILGRHYSISGRVTQGQQLGKKLGFPTANINLSKHSSTYAAPKNGVYFVYVYINSKRHKALANVGTRPTVNGVTRNLEVHLLDYKEADFYGAYITVEFLHFHREEIRFSSIDLLKAQIIKDILVAKAYFT